VLFELGEGPSGHRELFLYHYGDKRRDLKRRIYLRLRGPGHGDQKLPH
jgi:hypothetical protein